MSDDSDDSPKNALDPDLVRELAAILNESDLLEIEVKHGGLKLRLSRAAPGMQTAMALTAAPAAAPAALPSPAPAPAVSEASREPAPGAPPAGAVTSPMVGTVYLRPSPEEPVFAEPGKEVKQGATILLIEAMKTFNPITAPRSGVLSRVLVGESQPVEFGEPLFVIE